MNHCDLRLEPEQVRIGRIRVTPGFLFCAALLLYQSTPPFLVTFLFAALIHELGHVLAACWQRIPIRTLSLTAFGCVLTFVDSALLSNRKLLLVAVAGPALNLVSLLVCMGPWCGGWKYCALFGAEHLLLALFNLLPIFPLDGAVILSCLFSRWIGPERAERWVNGVSVFLAVTVGVVALCLGGTAGVRFFLFAAWMGLSLLQKMQPTLVNPLSFR